MVWPTSHTRDIKDIIQHNFFYRVDCNHILCLQIPYLMQLKLLPNVTFAGVDTPEDITESTYEELFHAGGFVASDKTVLENLTLG